MNSPLRQARERHGITLQHLATLVGSDVGNLSRIERGAQTPSKALAERICSVFTGEINELHLIYPSRFADGNLSGASSHVKENQIRELGHAGRQPPSPTNILDTIPAHSVVLPAIPPSLEPKEKP